MANAYYSKSRKNISNKEISENMTKDIDEMEKMLNEYLQFASSTFSEKDELFDLSKTFFEKVTLPSAFADLLVFFLLFISTIRGLLFLFKWVIIF